MNERYWKECPDGDVHLLMSPMPDIRIKPAHPAAGEWQTDLSLIPEAKILLLVDWGDEMSLWRADVLLSLSERSKLLIKRFAIINPPEVSNG